MAEAARLMMRQLTPPDTARLPFPSRALVRRQHKPLSPLRNGRCRCSHLSMNGCGGDSDGQVGVCQTRTLPAASAPDSAMSQLRSALSALGADPPEASSGIVRLQVPVRQRSEAIAWLHAQKTLPRLFFSGRGGRGTDAALNGAGARRSTSGNSLVSVAGVGSAVYFRRLEPFSLGDWKCIKRFLSKDCPLIRAYGAIRFDATTNVSAEWKDFGSFYFAVPQVEFDELEESSRLAINIAWDNNLHWPWEKAINSLQNTMQQISLSSASFQRQVPTSIILSSSHTPTKAYWDAAVKKALQMIHGENAELSKVVLARSTRVLTDVDIDPIILLACLQIEGQNAYQFCIQPAGGPAFIGNTPEQLFHRENLNVLSEALAGTRARGRTIMEDFQNGQDLLFSPKDDTEFTIVREHVKRKLEIICDKVLVGPKKAIRKLPRVQHLCAQLSGRLKNEDDEFNILTHLHPTPAVCGLPTEEARMFIAETETFDRGMYAGPVGWFGGSETEFAVGIRSALVGKGIGTLIYAGAGIVEGTISSSEWEEVELKASQFTKLVQCEGIDQAVEGQLTYALPTEVIGSRATSPCPKN
uniref:isochorismate synthase n=1 Tax=Anthurium amnicola TaxID=1678845 RepID=A0A1D1YNM1_9ARAE